MYLIVDDNPNCGGEERVFAESGEKRPVQKVQVDSPDGIPVWCEVTGVEEGGVFVPAVATRVEDSSDGTAWLIYGGLWGIRLRMTPSSPWSLNDKTQWGRPFLVLDGSGAGIKFTDQR